MNNSLEIEVLSHQTWCPVKNITNMVEIVLVMHQSEDLNDPGINDPQHKW